MGSVTNRTDDKMLDSVTDHRMGRITLCGATKKLSTHLSDN